MALGRRCGVLASVLRPLACLASANVVPALRLSVAAGPHKSKLKRHRRTTHRQGESSARLKSLPVSQPKNCRRKNDVLLRDPPPQRERLHDRLVAINDKPRPPPRALRPLPAPVARRQCSDRKNTSNCKTLSINISSTTHNRGNQWAPLGFKGKCI